MRHSRNCKFKDSCIGKSVLKSYCLESEEKVFIGIVLEQGKKQLLYKLASCRIFLVVTSLFVSLHQKPFIVLTSELGAGRAGMETLHFWERLLLFGSDSTTATVSWSRFVKIVHVLSFFQSSLQSWFCVRKKWVSEFL